MKVNRVTALVKPELPSVFIAPDDHIYEKNISNIEEVRARNGRVLAIASEGDHEAARVADEIAAAGVPVQHAEAGHLVYIVYIVCIYIYIDGV